MLHDSIVVNNAISIDASEVIVVYRGNDKNISRTIIKGPTLHVPAADEWIHNFSWHGKDPRDPHNKTRKIPGGLQFTKLRIIPDHFYYNVSEVRTSDDALITCKFMVFYAISDIELMLNQTHDPIGDFINAIAADAVAFVSTLPYEMFLEKCTLLNNLETFPQLTVRSKVL
jgi:hypothetical protein